MGTNAISPLDAGVEGVGPPLVLPVSEAFSTTTSSPASEEEAPPSAQEPQSSEEPPIPQESSSEEEESAEVEVIWQGVHELWRSGHQL